MKVQRWLFPEPHPVHDVLDVFRKIIDIVTWLQTEE